MCQSASQSLAFPYITAGQCFFSTTVAGPPARHALELLELCLQLETWGYREERIFASQGRTQSFLALTHSAVRIMSQAQPDFGNVCCTLCISVNCGKQQCVIFASMYLCFWAHLANPVSADPTCSAEENKRKEKTTPFGFNSMRSQVLYQAAQSSAEAYIWESWPDGAPSRLLQIDLLLR